MIKVIMNLIKSRKRKYPVGTIRTWNNIKFKKMPDKKWERISKENKYERLEDGIIDSYINEIMSLKSKDMYIVFASLGLSKILDEISDAGNVHAISNVRYLLTANAQSILAHGTKGSAEERFITIRLRAKKIIRESNHPKLKKSIFDFLPDYSSDFHKSIIDGAVLIDDSVPDDILEKARKGRKPDPIGKRTKRADGVYVKDRKDHWSKVSESNYDIKKIKDWRAKLRTKVLELKDEAEIDGWIGGQFAKSKKPIAHVLYAARSIIGPGVELSSVSSSGFKAFCKSIIQKAYQDGPSVISKKEIEVWEAAFKTLFKKAEGKKEKWVPLKTALNQKSKKQLFRAAPKWFEYCAKRMASKNEGMVDMNGIEEYMKHAMDFHKSKNPPTIKHDVESIKLGMKDPREAAKQFKEKHGTITPESKMKRTKKKYVKIRSGRGKK